VKNPTEVGYIKRPPSGGLFVCAEVIGPLPGPDGWSRMRSRLFRLTYLATIAIAMFGWIWLLVSIVERLV
jgi:hypothetical protein